MKRFTDNEKWTKNKWFRKLRNDLKLFWLFILDNCDMVGVWEEDIEFVGSILSVQFNKEELLSVFSNQILVVRGGKKWWIKSFCQYQYGTLKEENIKNKPHQRYIAELKKHRLWVDYTKTIHSLEEKEQEKEQEDYIEPKKDFSKPPTDMELLPVGDCLNYYFTLEMYVRTREANCMKSGLDMKGLEAWAVKFNDFLIRGGKGGKQIRDYVEHFGNWLAKQDVHQLVQAAPQKLRSAQEIIAEREAKRR